MGYTIFLTLSSSQKSTFLIHFSNKVQKYRLLNRCKKIAYILTKQQEKSQCCISEIIEFNQIQNKMFTPLEEENPYDIVQPSDINIKVWRYMDFTKYVSLLITQSLYLTRSDHFEDPFEGSMPRHNIESQNKKIINQLRNDYSDKHLQHIVNTTAEGIAKYYREFTFVNCWHMNEYESAAMWRLYAKSDEAIAIQTTFGKLHDSLLPEFSVGKVVYVDFNTYIPEVGMDYLPIMLKRKSFEHEKELRVFYLDRKNFMDNVINNKDGKNLSYKNPKSGLFAPVNISALIESVYIAPKSSLWFTELVKEVTEKFGFNFPVYQSSIYDKPLF